MSLGEDQVFLCNYLLYAKGGICHFRQSTYVNLHWNDISHLGSVLRLPSNYLYNQKRNYYSLCALIPLYGNCVKAYAVDYGINRPITRILYNYTKAQKSCLLQKGELKQFVKNEIIPFISSIDTSVYTVRNRNVRFVRFLLLNAGANIAIKYCYIYNVVNSCPKLIKSICKKIYKTINDKHNRQA